MAATYLDSSAIVKRAVLPAGNDAVAAGRKVLSRLDLVRISTGVLDEAGVLLPADLRSLDAIHLATARKLGKDLGAIVTYDERMADAAIHLGCRVAAPR